MSWITFAWGAAAGANLVFAVFYFITWLQQRASVASLFFSIAAASVALTGVIEQLLMRAESIGQFAAVHRAGHVSTFLVLVFLLLFVRFYFGTGCRPLLWFVLASRVVVLVLAFVPGPTFNFSRISDLVPVGFLGETIVVPIGEPSPWARFGELSVLLAMAFIIHASWQLWRKGGRNERRRALVIGAGVTLCIGLAISIGFLIHTGRARVPYVVSFSFLILVSSIAYELSRDLVRAKRTADALRESERRIDLAAAAAQLGLWTWDIGRDEIWAMPQARTLFGFAPDERIDLENVLSRIAADDRARVRRTLDAALAGEGEFHEEYRVRAGVDGAPSLWVATDGNVEFDAAGTPVLMRGVSINVTDRKHSEAEAEELRRELAHAGRVTVLGQLASSLAHELSQPLSAILRNAETAEILLGRADPDLDELRAIVTDIKSDDQRAAGVIDRLRTLLRRGSLEAAPLEVAPLVAEVIALVRPDAVSRRITMTQAVPGHGCRVQADRVHLQQVLLNLIVNAMDAIDAADATQRTVGVSVRERDDGMVEFSVEDSGPGFQDGTEAGAFEPFFTTKATGMGMGLAVSRTIVEAHGGRIWAGRCPDPTGGAVVRFTLKAAPNVPGEEP